MLVCRNCGAQNRDIGVDPSRLLCWRCHHQELARVPEEPPLHKEGVGGAILGSGVGWLLGGPPGAVIGAVIGAIFGENERKGGQP